MNRSAIIKICLFATGLSGIVAEYLLATLASYFISDTVLQWTMIVSIMLFSMGLGSRISRSIDKNLLVIFITIECILSILVSVSSMMAFLATSYTIYSGLIIYGMSILIGIMIGMEIPIAIRLNDQYETLKVNVSGILENDYYGSLAGGLFYGFVAKQYIGLTYTPYLLGFVNLSVAISLFFILYTDLSRTKQRKVVAIFSVTTLIILIGLYLAKPIELYGEQKRYKDKVIFSEQTKYQNITITEWRDNHWLYINGNQQLCTIDEKMYHEPLVHPAMMLAGYPQDILILGGGDGCAAREVLKYETVRSIDLVDLDPRMTELGMENEILVELNENSMTNPKVNVINNDGFKFLELTEHFYDVIIVDLPDPKSIDLGKLYSREFYQLCQRKLRQNGILITQAGSPYFATKAFICIQKTMRAAGFSVLPIHNQVVTLGEWGWVIGSKNTELSLKKLLHNINFDELKTEWLNNDAATMMTLFGKKIYVNAPDTSTVEVNTLNNPVLPRYYMKGNWDIY